MFKGSLVALVTPFDRNDRVDFASLKRLVEFHVEQGTSALVIAGTTGESPTLSHDEHERVIGAVVKAAEKVRDRLLYHAGVMMGEDPSALTCAAGFVTSPAGKRPTSIVSRLSRSALYS